MSLKERVQTRLDQLKISPFEAARRGDLERQFVHDIIIDRKKSVRGDNLLALAKALDCDPEYLLEKTTDPGAAPSAARAQLPFRGVIEPGAWRRVEPVRLPDRVPIAPDVRFPTDGQEAYLMRGPDGQRFGVDDGMILATAPHESWAASNTSKISLPLVIRRKRPNGEYETSLWALEVNMRGASIVDPYGERRAWPPTDEKDLEVRGVVSKAVRLFG